jgi:hypothetical protein
MDETAAIFPSYPVRKVVNKEALMRTHIIILAWLHIVLNGLTLLLGAGIMLLLFGIGGAAAVSGGHEALPAVPILGTIGTFILLCFAIVSVPGIAVGVGLLNLAPWARIGGIIISILQLFNFPFGTAVGIYGLVVLFNPETVALFERGSGTDF